MTDEAKCKLDELDHQAVDLHLQVRELHERVSSIPPANVTIHDVATVLREVTELAGGVVALIRLLKGL